MNHEVVLQINTTLARTAVGRTETFASLETKIKAAMLGVLEGNWLETRDQELMRAALAGVLMAYPKDSREVYMVTESWKGLIRFVDWMNSREPLQAGSTLPSLTAEDGSDLLPLMVWWEAAKKECAD
jgi:hypothetical protein